MGIQIDITRRKQLEGELREKEGRDALTGCFNRRHRRLLADEVEASGMDWGPVVVEIDHVKQNNPSARRRGQRAATPPSRW